VVLVSVSLFIEFCKLKFFKLELCLFFSSIVLTFFCLKKYSKIFLNSTIRKLDHNNSFLFIRFNFKIVGKFGEVKGKRIWLNFNRP